jgi:hypothetical protein
MQKEQSIRRIKNRQGDIFPYKRLTFKRFCGKISIKKDGGT